MIKMCKICQTVKHVKDFCTAGIYKEKQYYRSECRKCSYEVRKEKSKEYAKEYRQRKDVKKRRSKYKKSEENKQTCRKRSKLRYDTDPLYRLKKCLRSRLKYSLKAGKWKKSEKSEKILGASYEEVRTYIESQFHSGMGWENHGILWEIEHTTALGFAQTEEELYKLCHYTNIRPMLITEHTPKSIEDTKQIIILRKANKIA